MTDTMDSQDTPVRRIVIVGGGTAGWMAACRLAAARRDLSVTLVEDPAIPTIGVGEGTWPTMRATLSAIGIDEATFLTRCDASFKQGSRFDRWRTGADDDSYYHPFTPPADDAMIDAWASDTSRRYDDAVTEQVAVCDADLAPRRREMPDYQGALNYAYHLDAGKFAALLTERALDLGVTHLADSVIDVTLDGGDIAAVATRSHGEVEGDLFIDCTGKAALLIEKALGVGWVEHGGTLFNDRALAAQVPVPAGSPIASETIGTAHEAGWIWDIALPTRRGIGCVFSSRHLDEDRARQILADYVAKAVPSFDMADFAPRLIEFSTGHREQFWHRNCIALGMASGFIEPLEASAIVMIELALADILADFPEKRSLMGVLSRRYNATFTTRWDRIVEFLKLHYVLSQRDEPYWRAHRDKAHWPDRLEELLSLWQVRAPSGSDFPLATEIFPAESHQYVLYGMGFPPPSRGTTGPRGTAADNGRIERVRQRARGLLSALPTNRTYLDALAAGAREKQKVTT